MDNAQIFLDKYKVLESVAREAYNLDINKLKEDRRFSQIKQEIDYCREIRNLLTHRPKIANRYPLDPSDAVIGFLEDLIFKIKNPKRINEVAIDISKIYSKQMGDLVMPTMSEMRKKVYTHVPILNDGKVVGVFDENSIFNYLSDKTIILIDEELTFEGIKDYLGITGRDMERFLFIERNATVDEVKDSFAAEFEKGNRVGIAFITHSGKQDEKILSMVTPWDLANV